MDSYHLQRFIEAQSRDYERALQEIKNGFKQSHWIWYIFPQLKGFGHSYNSEYYGITGLDEAQAYYYHPVLGSRLIEITKALLKHKDKFAVDILSPIDVRKVRSSMTLFWIASNNPLFKEVIDVFYEGKMDNKTISKTGRTSQLSYTSKTSKTTNMRYHQNPFKVEYLDFLIIDQAIRGSGFDEHSPKVTALFNFFGRWFSKRFIVDRIRYIDETSQKEGRHIPSFIETDGYFHNAFKELNKLYENMSNEQNNDKTRYIDVNCEIMVEINNLCHFNEPHKAKTLLKHIIPNWLGGSGIYLRHMFMNLIYDNDSRYRINQLPQEMVLFWWADNKVPHVMCYVSTKEEATFSEAFSIDFSDTNGNDCDPDDLGWYYFIGKESNLPNVLNYSGTEFVPVFRMEGDDIVSCIPPLIRHEYHLKPLRIPVDNFCLGADPEFFDKYYALYHTGNWNAKYAIERGGFNLNG